MLGYGIVGIVITVVAVIGAVIWWVTHGKPQMWDRRHSSPRYNNFISCMNRTRSRVRSMTVRSRVRRSAANASATPATTASHTGAPATTTTTSPTGASASHPIAEVSCDMLDSIVL